MTPVEATAPAAAAATPGFGEALGNLFSAGKTNFVYYGGKLISGVKSGACYVGNLAYRIGAYALDKLCTLFAFMKTHAISLGAWASLHSFELALVGGGMALGIGLVLLAQYLKS